MSQVAPFEVPRSADGARPHENSTRAWNAGQILRSVGGAMLVASFSTFLLRPWDAYSDVVRYAVMLVHTLLLVASALFCSFWIRENRGARTLLVLTLAAVPFNLAILAGFVYSRHCLDGVSLAKPTSFLWVASSEAQLLTLLVVAVPILVGSAWFALRALVRSQSQPTLMVFALSNALLLIPLRAPLFSAVTFVVAVAALAILDRCHFGNIAVFETQEGRLVRLLLAAPVVLMLGRSMFLYPDFLFVTGALGLGAGIWLAMWARRDQQSKKQQILILLSVVAVATGWLLFWIELVAVLAVPATWQLPTLLLPAALLLEGIGQVSGERTPKLRVLSAAALVLATALQIGLHPCSSVEIYSALVGIAWLLLGLLWHSKIQVVSGGVALAAALIHQLVTRVRFEYLSHWLFLSLTGVGLILVASYFERHQILLRQRFSALLRRTRHWDY